MGKTVREPMVVAMMVVAIAITGGGGRAAGEEVPSCAKYMYPCVAAIESSSVEPGKYCCASVQLAVTVELECVCGLYNSSSSFFEHGSNQKLPLSRTRALEIPALCGIQNFLSLCNIASESASASEPPSYPGSPPGNSGSQSKASRLNIGNAAMAATVWTLASILIH